jgi:hypothetical protein
VAPCVDDALAPASTGNALCLRRTCKQADDPLAVAFEELGVAGVEAERGDDGAAVREREPTEREELKSEGREPTAERAPGDRARPHR